MGEKPNASMTTVALETYKTGLAHVAWRWFPVCPPEKLFGDARLGGHVYR